VANYIGTAAQGKIYRYRYYTCCTRQRYGTHTCAGERVDAGRLDEAVLESLLRTYLDQWLLDEAVQYLDDARAARPNRLEQLASVQADIRRSEEALVRYFSAFESGSMPEDLCRPRIERLAERLRSLRAHQAELTASIEEGGQVTAPGIEEVERLRDRIREALLNGPVVRRKAVLQELVAEVRVESRSCIRPTFRLPLAGVRELSQMVRPEGVEPSDRQDWAR
jgi:site-specific DNA recombinase